MLRAGVTKARKDLDDISAKIEDQVGLINTAVGRATPDIALMQYKKALRDLIDDGDTKLTLFNDKKGTLVEKLELLLLKFESPDSLEQFNKGKSLRDKLGGKASHIEVVSES